MRRVTEHKIRSIKKIIFILFALTFLIPASTPLVAEEYYLRVYFSSATVNDQALSPSNPEIRVSPGQRIKGYLEVIVDNNRGGSWITPVIGTQSWTRGQFSCIATDAPTGMSRQIYEFDLTAPSTPGTYYIGVFAGWMYTCGEVASNDHPQNFGDGDDVWDMSDSDWESVISDGQAPSESVYRMPGRAIRVVVIGYTPPQVSIDVFTDKGGKGTDPDGGFYNIGDDITIYCSIDRDVDFLKVWVEKPDGTSVTLHSGSAKAGTYRFPGKVGEPAGERKVKAFAYVAGETFSDEVRFYVSETKKPPEQGCKIDITELYSEPEEIYVGDTFCISGRIKNVGSAGICSFGWFVLDWSPRENLEPRGIIACSPYGREAKLGEEVTPSTCPRPCFKALKPGRVKITVGATACSDYSLCSADYLPRGCCECSETATYCNTTEVIEVVVKQKLGRLTHFDLDYHGNPPNSDGNDQTSITVSPGAKLRIFFRYDEGTSGTPYIIRVYAEWDKKNYLANSDGNEAYPEEGGMEIGGFRWDVEEYTVPTTPGVYKVRVVYSKSSVPPTWDNYDILLAEGTIVVQSQVKQKLGRLTHFDLDYHGNPPNSDGNDQTSITVSPGAKLRIFFRYDEGTSGTPYIIRVYAEWDKKNYLANSDGNEAYPEEGGMEIGGFRWDVEEYTVPTTPGVYKVRVVYSKSSVPPTWDNYDILLAEGTIVVQSQENQKPTAYIDSIKPNPAYKDDEIEFKGHGYDPDGSISKCEWKSSKDGFLSNSCSFKGKLSVGTHTIYFRVMDDKGAWSDWTTATVVVKGGERPRAEFSYTPGYAEEVISLPEGRSYELYVEGSGRALIVRVESVDRMFILGSFIKNRYSVNVYKDGETVTTLNPDVSMIENPGDPAILELAVRPGKARYKIVVTTEDIGCVPFVNWPCNGDRVSIKVLVGHFTTKMARNLSESLSKAIPLWDNPGLQWIGKTLLQILGGIDPGRSTLENSLRVTTDHAIKLIAEAYGIPYVSDIKKMVELILNQERYMREAEFAGELTTTFSLHVAQCARTVQLHPLECPNPPPPYQVWALHNSVNDELQSIYERLGVTPIRTLSTPRDYDYIGNLLRLIQRIALGAENALRAGDLRSAYHYSLEVENVRPYMQWIIEKKADEVVTSDFYRGAYDFTKILVISYFG